MHIINRFNKKFYLCLVSCPLETLQTVSLPGAVGLSFAPHHSWRKLRASSAPSSVTPEILKNKTQQYHPQTPTGLSCLTSSTVH